MTAKPTKPCPRCNSPIFWKGKDGSWRCYIHENPNQKGAEVAEKLVLEAALKSAWTEPEIVRKSAAYKDSPLDSFPDRPTSPCPMDGGVVFWRSNSNGLWSCLIHNTPISEEDVAEVFNVDTEELVKLPETIETGAKKMDLDQYDFNKVAKGINSVYHTKITAKEAEELFEDVYEKALVNALAAGKAGVGGLFDPHPVEALTRSLTGPAVAAEKSRGPLPTSDRDPHGRRTRKRAKLNRDGHGRVIGARDEDA